MPRPDSERPLKTLSVRFPLEDLRTLKAMALKNEIEPAVWMRNLVKALVEEYQLRDVNLPLGIIPQLSGTELRWLNYLDTTGLSAWYWIDMALLALLVAYREKRLTTISPPFRIVIVPHSAGKNKAPTSDFTPPIPTPSKDVDLKKLASYPVRYAPEHILALDRLSRQKGIDREIWIRGLLAPLTDNYRRGIDITLPLAVVPQSVITTVDTLTNMSSSIEINRSDWIKAVLPALREYLKINGFLPCPLSVVDQAKLI
jgi:hypothetical protein